jgi:Arc/MetJ-type ribon-helix-helix transcriptional regulator
METISVRFEEDFVDDMEKIMKGNRYATKAEFIREAVRDKMKDLETQAALMRLEKVYGSSKRRTTKEQMKRAKEEAFEEIANRFK